MARQPGARTQVAFAFESVYGTPPASGYRRMPFATTTLGSEQGLLSPELLGYGRDPQAPIRDAVNVDGDVVIPMDAENLGFWLKAIFGQPVTTGTTPRTHTFQSGGFTLPSMAIETQMPDVPRFAMYSGLVADRIQWQSQRSGLLTATVGLIGRGETVAATTAAGTLTDTTLPLQRFGNFQGSITRNGAALSNIVSAQVSYAIAATVTGIPDSLGGKRMAIRVAELARAGLTPNWMPGAVPRCVPSIVKQNQHGTHAGTIVMGTERILVRGARATWKTIDILACPVTFSPHPQQIEAARRGYEEWRQALG